MSNDISSMLTKEMNIKGSRKGYGAWKHEKITAFRPCDYGDYVLQRRKRHPKEYKK